jgi:hypothetical protein
MSVSADDNKGYVTGLRVDDVLRSLESSPVPQSLCERVREADANKDGILSVGEFVQLVLSEQQAVSQRRLFRRLLWVLGVGSLLLIAALVGCVYGIVDLTRQVDDNDRVLSSRATGEAMATGQVLTLSSNLSSLVGDQSTSIGAALQMDRVVVPEEDGGFSVQRVTGVRVSPSDGAVLSLASGESVSVGVDGTLSVIQPSGNSNSSTPGRRLLQQGQGQQVVAVGGSQVIQPEGSSKKRIARTWTGIFGKDWGEDCNPIEVVVCCDKDSIPKSKVVSISVCGNGMPPTNNGKCGQNCDFWGCDKGTCIPDTGFFQYAPSSAERGAKTLYGVPQSVSESMNDDIWKRKLNECQALGPNVKFGAKVHVFPKPEGFVMATIKPLIGCY